jgi:hypothetical protein
MSYWPDKVPTEVAMLYVEHFYHASPTGEMTVDSPASMSIYLHRYIVSFIGETPAGLCNMIAETISDCAAVNVPLERMHGTVFLNSLIYAAVDNEVAIGFMPLESWQPRPDDLPWVLFHSPPEGGVEVGYGDDEPWDPTIWEIRFGQRNAS